MIFQNISNITSKYCNLAYLLCPVRKIAGMEVKVNECQNWKKLINKRQQYATMVEAMEGQTPPTLNSKKIEILKGKPRHMQQR